MTAGPTILAAGPWTADQVTYTWLEEPYVAAPEDAAAADAAIQRLKDRDSPSHDGVATRLAGHTVGADGALHLELEPVRWALRLLPGGAVRSMTGQCVVRDSEGRWLAGRRADWVATWAGRWSLGAGGAVDPGESPMRTLERELAEEWNVQAARLEGLSLVLLPSDLVMFVGIATLAPGAEVDRDPEHDAHEWWPADVDAWPDHAEQTLRGLARAVQDMT
jgi:8-oxo-dGTP pyrophosphatase MutT (NUDIX family)